MCTTCGCGTSQIRINGKVIPRPQLRTQPGKPMRYKLLTYNSAQTSAPVHAHAHDITPVDTEIVGNHVPGRNQVRRIKIERAILSKNNHYADENRRILSTQGIFSLNLVSSPGSGKTTLLVQTIYALHGKQSLAVIEGDQQTDNDAARIRATGATALQVNTGKGCHLDAHMINQAIQRLNLKKDSLLLIENVGNLVCPSSFDLGEAHKIVILSVTEGEDKPLKYPDIFRAADLMLLNKCDLLPYLSFDVELALAYAHRINPALRAIQISATNGTGMLQWLDWIMAGCRQQQVAHAPNNAPSNYK